MWTSCEILRRLTEKITASQPHILVKQAENSGTHGRTGCEDVFVSVVSFVSGPCLEELTDRKTGQRRDH